MVALHQTHDAQARLEHQRGDDKKIYDFLVYDSSIRKDDGGRKTRQGHA